MPYTLFGVPLDEIKLPYTTSADLQLKEPWHPLTARCQFCETDSVNYKSSGGSIKVFIYSKKDDVLTGTFGGMIRTKTGKSKSVMNGKFRIKVIRKPR